MVITVSAPAKAPAAACALARSRRMRFARSQRRAPAAGNAAPRRLPDPGRRRGYRRGGETPACVLAGSDAASTATAALWPTRSPAPAYLRTVEALQLGLPRRLLGLSAAAGGPFAPPSTAGPGLFPEPAPGPGFPPALAATPTVEAVPGNPLRKAGPKLPGAVLPATRVPAPQPERDKGAGAGGFSAAERPGLSAKSKGGAHGESSLGARRLVAKGWKPADDTARTRDHRQVRELRLNSSVPCHFKVLLRDKTPITQ